MDEKWYQISGEETLRKLDSKRSGLTAAQVSEKLLEYGPNQLEGRKKTSPVLVFLQQFLSPLIYVLLVAAIITAATSHFLDTWVILGALILNAIIGFVQERRAEKAMEALLRMAAPKASVRRDGIIREIPAHELVPGDIVIFEVGDKIPADARLLEISNLKTNEATLTGESVPVDKYTKALQGELPVAERKNMVFMGTVITYGRATAVVVRTGMATEMGKIASGIREVKREPTPLQRSVSRLSKYLVGIFLGVCVLLVIVGLVKGLDYLEVFLLAVAAAVSAIPEGLPAVLTVVLAMGMRMMARRNAIIRKLVAVETLGSATVICSDKTGTLTLNQMTVRQIYAGSRKIVVSGEGYEPYGEFICDDRKLDCINEPDIMLHLRIGALCNDAIINREGEKSWSVVGDPTEGALMVAAEKAGLNRENLDNIYPRLDEIPFQSEKLYMATFHPSKEGRVAYVKGATEKLLSMSKYLYKDGKKIPLKQADIRAITEVGEGMAADAMRVIATACVDLPGDLEDLEDEHLQGDLAFVGLSGMADPPREEARESIRLCRQAGIKVIMITGDNRVTAESIARQLQLPPGKAVNGTELKEMSDEQLLAQVEDISVFARIEPIQKLRIVNALKQRGHVVAMTGDGVNDAPALKTANIGIAMGITGTDVAKEASDMTLADDNFTSIVAAVDEGRSIFNRLRNVIFFLLSTNIGELLALILSILFVGQAPLLAVQIIWNNLLTDTAVAVPLGLEPKSGDELKQPPRHPGVGIIYPGMLMRVFYMAVLMGVTAFVIFIWAREHMSIEEARTLTFCTLVTFEWFKAFVARSDELTVFRLGIFRNRWLVLSVSVAVLLQMAVIYVPFLQDAFRTAPLSPGQWGIVLLAGGGLFIVEEARKFFFPGLFSRGKWQPAGKES
ncbi:MAG TPA: HAD-IC family P-type ATPase [Dehalococcoidia bacterium]|nr:HAD-IC family P-type ATPase [Dehalococcoidia bacterium]